MNVLCTAIDFLAALQIREGPDPYLGIEIGDLWNLLELL